MTYEVAARLLAKYAKTVNVPDLQIAIQMGAEALFKREAAERAINYSDYISEEEETEENAPMAE